MMIASIMRNKLQLTNYTTNKLIYLHTTQNILQMCRNAQLHAYFVNRYLGCVVITLQSRVLTIEVERKHKSFPRF